MPEEMDPIEKVKTVILNPSEFFEEIKSEEGIGKAFVYLAVLSLINLLAGIIAFTFNISILSPLGSLSQFLPFLGQYAPLVGITLPVGIYILSLVGSFIGAGFVHLLVRLLGGKGSYSMTYKALVYSSTPSLLLGWIPYVGVIPGIYSFYLYLKGLSMLHLISMKRVFVAIFVIPVVVLLGLTIASAGVAYLYISSLFTGKTPTRGIGLVDALCSNDIVSVTVRNIGTNPVTSIECKQTAPASDTICSPGFANVNIQPGLSQTFNDIDTCSGTESRFCQYSLTPESGKSIQVQVFCAS